jgi:hypothetical protein
MIDFENEIKENRKFLKKGDNVVHLEYLGGTIVPGDINKFEVELKQVGIELSRLDKSKELWAKFDYNSLVTFFYLSQPLINQIIKGTISNAAWLVIKSILLKIWRNVRGKKYTHLSINNSIEKKITFGVKAKIDFNTTFEFNFENINDNQFDSSLDKIIIFLSNQKPNSSFQRPHYMNFDEKSLNWYTKKEE